MRAMIANALFHFGLRTTQFATRLFPATRDEPQEAEHEPDYLSTAVPYLTDVELHHTRHVLQALENSVPEDSAAWFALNMVNEAMRAEQERRDHSQE